MKKLLLFGLAASVSLSAIAQNRLVSPHNGLVKNHKIENAATAASVEKKVPAVRKNTGLRNPHVSPTVISDITIGSSGNAFGVFNIRAGLDCNPSLNTVTFGHRSATGTGGALTTGNIYFDVSKDGGNTWSNDNGPLYEDTTGAGNGARARYPSAVIYNPAGNTDANNAFITCFGPSTDGAAWWASYEGTGQLSNPYVAANHKQHFYLNPLVPTGEGTTVPDGMVITQQGQTYGYDAYLTDNTLASAYGDSLILRHGVFNPTTLDFDYSTIFVEIPLDVDMAGGKNFAGQTGVAFANDGMTGYAWVNGHMNFAIAPDSAYFIGISKTTDGGMTWGIPRYVNFNGTGAGTVDALLGSSGTNGLYTTWTESDGVVDMNGNLHIVLTIGPSTNPNGNSFNIDITPGGYGMFDLYTTDQGTTYKAELLGKPMTFDAAFTGGGSNQTEFSRGQAAKTWAGDKVFFAWMETDTVKFPGATENLNPDIRVRAFDVVSGMWTNNINITDGSDADGICLFMNMAPYVLGTTGTYEIPCTYTKILGDISTAVEHHYVDGLSVTDADFSVAANPTNALTTFLSVKELDGNISNITNIFPNPSSSVAYMVLSLNKSAEVSYDIKNMLGQNVFSQRVGALNAGQNTLTLNTSKLSKGIYLVNVKADNSSVTKKLVVQ